MSDSVFRAGSESEIDDMGLKEKREKGREGKFWGCGGERKVGLERESR